MTTGPDQPAPRIRFAVYKGTVRCQVLLSGHGSNEMQLEISGDLTLSEQVRSTLMAIRQEDRLEQPLEQRLQSVAQIAREMLTHKSEI